MSFGRAGAECSVRPWLRKGGSGSREAGDQQSLSSEKKESNGIRAGGTYLGASEIFIGCFLRGFEWLRYICWLERRSKSVGTRWWQRRGDNRWTRYHRSWEGVVSTLPLEKWRQIRENSCSKARGGGTGLFYKERQRGKYKDFPSEGWSDLKVYFSYL